MRIAELEAAREAFKPAIYTAPDGKETWCASWEKLVSIVKSEVDRCAAERLKASRAKWNEKRRAFRNKVPSTFEELGAVHRAVLEYACYDGRVLVSGARMAHYRAVAEKLSRMGLLYREEGTSFFSPTEAGLRLYGRRVKRS